jgi:hypothetical protein
MTEKPQFRNAPRDDFDLDLQPDHLAGQNIGARASEQSRSSRTAFDLKPVHNSLRDWPDDELKAIPVIDEGEALLQGATYINLADQGQGEITAMGDMRAGAADAFVPKSEVPYTTWNRLRGIDSPERTGGDTYR